MGALSACKPVADCKDASFTVVSPVLQAIDAQAVSSQASRNQRLLVAAQNGNVTALKGLLDQGANKETRRPVAIARHADYVDENGFKRPSQVGMTPLMHAAHCGHAGCVEELVKCRANVNAEEEDGLRPIHFAAASGNYDVALTLARAGAYRKALDANGRSALSYLPDDLSAPYKKWKDLLSLGTKVP